MGTAKAAEASEGGRLKVLRRFPIVSRDLLLL